MKKFLVLYRAPLAVLDEWMKKSEEERQQEEATMKTQWDEWMKAHSEVLRETAGVGKAMRVTSQGSDQSRNDIMLFSLVEAQSEEAAAALFANHPHLQIPQSSIEIMPVNYLPA